MIYVKDGVRFRLVSSKILWALLTLDVIVDELAAQPITITSLNRPNGPETLHDDGQAVDVRTRDWQAPAYIANRLTQVLGEDYDVVLESDHLHIEYDPKQTTII